VPEVLATRRKGSFLPFEDPLPMEAGALLFNSDSFLFLPTSAFDDEDSSSSSSSSLAKVLDPLTGLPELVFSRLAAGTGNDLFFPD